MNKNREPVKACSIYRILKSLTQAPSERPVFFLSRDCPSKASDSNAGRVVLQCQERQTLMGSPAALLSISSEISLRTSSTVTDMMHFFPCLTHVDSAQPKHSVL